MTDVRIRRARANDRAVVLAFHRALYVEHRGTFLDPEIEPLYAYRDLDAALRDDVDAMLTADASVVLLAERDGRAVGYVTGHLESDPRRVLSRRGVVEDWFVTETERGHGTGRALLDTLVEIFTQAGCEVVESTTWASNTPARELHRALGFHDIEIKMRRKL
jgi:GNAT superfamily N-acetyltransferase